LRTPQAEVVPLRVCHSDLVPGNVLVSVDGRALILDWDDAGPWNATEELVAALVSWSTVRRASLVSGSRLRWLKATAKPVA
jgi:Ser/Thr protein kinase RdoA (MazF antagonist)